MMSKKEFAEWIAWVDKASIAELRKAVGVREELIYRKEGVVEELLAERWELLSAIDRKKRNNGK